MRPNSGEVAVAMAALGAGSHAPRPDYGESLSPAPPTVLLTRRLLSPARVDLTFAAVPGAERPGSLRSLWAVQGSSYWAHLKSSGTIDLEDRARELILQPP